MKYKEVTKLEEGTVKKGGINLEPSCLRPAKPPEAQAPRGAKAPSEKPNYWRKVFGQRSNEFINGVIAAMGTYAIWHDGKQTIGIQEQLLEEAIKEAKEGMEFIE